MLPGEVLERVDQLNISGAQCLFAGGLVLLIYGVGRTTGDKDIWLDDTDGQSESLRCALLNIGFDRELMPRDASLFSFDSARSKK